MLDGEKVFLNETAEMVRNLLGWIKIGQMLYGKEFLKDVEPSLAGVLGAIRIAQRKAHPYG